MSHSQVGGSMITEAYGKNLLHKHLSQHIANPECISVQSYNLQEDLLCDQHAWLTTKKLVVKPDQGIKRRGEEGLIKLDVDIDEAVKWIKEFAGQKKDTSWRFIHQFLLEPFVPHGLEEERYVAIYSELDHDVLLIYEKGGVDVGDVDAKAARVQVPLSKTLDDESLVNALSDRLSDDEARKLVPFMKGLFELYRDLHFTYLEINPMVVREKVHILDLAAKLDHNAESLCKESWGPKVQWATGAERQLSEQEKHISLLDSTCVGSVKLTILNKKGRLWPVMGGGGTPLMMADVMQAMGCLDELACYSQFTRMSNNDAYQLFKTVLYLMLEETDGDGKAFITGSAVVDLVTIISMKKMYGEGIFRALEECKDRMRAANVIFIIRSTVGVVSEKNEGVPSALSDLGIPVFIIGGDVSVQELVKFALKKTTVPPVNRPRVPTQPAVTLERETPAKRSKYTMPPEELNFTRDTKVLGVNMIPPGLQGIIDYDFICGKSSPSVTAIVRSSREQDAEEFSWGEGKVSIPVFSDLSVALKAHPDISVVSICGPAMPAYKAAKDAILSSQIKAVILMVGEIPLKLVRELIVSSKERNVMLIGPTAPNHNLQVNILKPGCFTCNLKGDLAAPLLDVVDLKLYRRGSVVLLAKSGGLSKELCVTVARNTDGLYLCVSLGSGRFQGSKFMDHLQYLHENPAVAMFCIVTEIGGVDEYQICEAMKGGQITKPVVVHCIGSSASSFQEQPVFFGHTGGGIDAKQETADAKHDAFRESGAIVADTFDDIGDKLREVFGRLKEKGEIPAEDLSTAPVIPENMKPTYLPAASC